MKAEHLILSRLNMFKMKFAFFVGAGISICSGIPLATTDLLGLPSIVTNIRNDFYSSLNLPKLSQDELLSWYVDQKLLQNSETLYSDALNLIGDTPRARQFYLRRFFDSKKPGTCHLSLAKLVEKEYVDIIFTTNFDPLIEDSIRKNLHNSAPKVAAHKESISDILLTEKGPKVIKLHGDYLFSDIKNTVEETEELTTNIREKLRTILSEKGIIIMGYSGSDNSVISVFEQMVYDGGFFPYGFYWLHRKNSRPKVRIQKIIEKAGGKFLPYDGAEPFLTEIIKRLEAIK